MARTRELPAAQTNSRDPDSKVGLLTVPAAGACQFSDSGADFPQGSEALKAQGSAVAGQGGGRKAR